MRAWNYPFDPVIIQCTLCGRKGRLTKKRFIKTVGMNTRLADSLRIIAADCKQQNKPTNITHDRCGAHFPELEIAKR